MTVGNGGNAGVVSIANSGDTGQNSMLEANSNSSGFITEIALGGGGLDGGSGGGGLDGGSGCGGFIVGTGTPG